MEASKKGSHRRPSQSAEKELASRAETNTPDVIKLNEEAWATLIEVIRNPPQPTPALKRLMRSK